MTERINLHFYKRKSTVEHRNRYLKSKTNVKEGEKSDPIAKLCVIMRYRRPTR